MPTPCDPEVAGSDPFPRLPVAGPVPSKTSTGRAGLARDVPRPAVIRHPLTVLFLACLLCLLPFAGKAYHIDDPLFLWTAEQIRHDPTNFYEFAVNWYRTVMPMWRVTMNPPLTAYYLAVLTTAFGEREIPIHLGFLVWSVGTVIGTYCLAHRLGKRPFLAGLVTLLTPVFLVSATNIMCDVMMLCLWVWAVVCWQRGIDQQAIGALCVAGILMGLAFWTKYFGIALVPLLGMYAAARHVPLRRWLAVLLIPLLMVAGYQWLTLRSYEGGLLTGAAEYAGQMRPPSALANLALGLAFTGGCVASALCYAPLLWRWRGLVAGLTVAAGLTALRLSHRPMRGGLVSGLLACELTLAMAGGLCVLALAVNDLWQRRDADSLLLFGWVAGTFVFAAFLNWTMNGRSILPLVPAAGILVMRRLDHLELPARWWSWPGWPLLPAAGLALAVTLADYRMAGSARAAAVQLRREYTHFPGPVWFEGHWGFQYYMQKLGARVVDFKNFPGNSPPYVMFIPRNSTYVLTLDPHQPYGILDDNIARIEKVSFATLPWAATMHPAMDAGFYSCSLGQDLPFAFGPAPPEEYYVIVGRARRRPSAAAPRPGSQQLAPAPEGAGKPPP